jgi:F-type H+-transporting ATPase subunit epsilon
MKEINVEIITPSKSAYKGNVKSINIPGTVGNFQVLYNHAPMISTFEIGKIKLVDMEDKTIEFATSGGTTEIKNNTVLVLADSVEVLEEVDVERAKKAYARAKERLSSVSKVDIDIMRAELALQRAANRMKFVGASF